MDCCRFVWCGSNCLTRALRASLLSAARLPLPGPLGSLYTGKRTADSGQRTSGWRNGQRDRFASIAGPLDLYFPQSFPNPMKARTRGAAARSLGVGSGLCVWVFWAHGLLPTAATVLGPLAVGLVVALVRERRRVRPARTRVGTRGRARPASVGLCLAERAFGPSRGRASYLAR